MQTITLSESALAVLRFRAKKYPVKVNDRTLPAYRELVAAGIMVPDQESGFQFTEDGWARRRNGSAPPKHIFAAWSLACRNGSTSRKRLGRHWSDIWRAIRK